MAAETVVDKLSLAATTNLKRFSGRVHAPARIEAMIDEAGSPGILSDVQHEMVCEDSG